MGEPMKLCFVHITLLFLIGLMSSSCHRTGEERISLEKDDGASVVVRKRDDGTTSSVSQVDEMNRVHGIRVTYYADGKTVYSRTTFNHGIKHGPSVRYYRNGQVFGHTNYANGKENGITRKYHKNGQLAAEFEYDHGIVLPGLKEYTPEGSLVTSYAEIRFTEEDHLATHHRIDLIMSCSKKGLGVKYYLLEAPGTIVNRVYLISEKGTASLQFYVKPGESIDRVLSIIAEIPTELGNVYVRELSYHLKVSN